MRLCYAEFLVHIILTTSKLHKHTNESGFVFVSQMWSASLASMADEWADGCTLERGQPNRAEDVMPYDPAGQNLYNTTAFDLERAIHSWYNESENYEYANGSCTDDCGRYLQVSSSSSYFYYLSPSLCSSHVLH